MADRNACETPADDVDSATSSGWATLGYAFVPSVIGVAILFLYRYTAFMPLIAAGIIWLMLGGIWALANSVDAARGYLKAARRGPAFVRAKRLYGWAILMGFVAVAVAILCVQAGFGLATTTPVRFIAYNATNVNIDRLAVHFANGDVTVDDVPARGSRTLELIWPSHGGSLDITVSARGQSRRKMDQSHVESRSFRNGRFTVTVEPAELPKGVR